MRTSKFSEEQIVTALRQAEAGTRVVEICRKMEITETTFYRWKKNYFGPGVSELRELCCEPQWTRQFGKRRLAFQLRIVRWKHNAGVQMDGSFSAPSLSGSRSLASCGRRSRSRS
jgi:hypothetical protein